MNRGAVLMLFLLGACSSVPLDEADAGSVPPQAESGVGVPVEQCTGACLHTYERSVDPFPARNTTYYACLCACGEDICKFITARGNSDK